MGVAWPSEQTCLRGVEIFLSQISEDNYSEPIISDFSKRQFKILLLDKYCATLFEEEAAAYRQRIEAVLIPGDEPVRGITTMAGRMGWSRQRLTYGLQHHRELKFIRQANGKPEAMASSLANVDGEAIEARVKSEQHARGQARGLANRKIKP